MNQFLTIEMLKAFPVAVSVTVILTEFFKDIIDCLFRKVNFHLPTKYIVFIFALIVIFLPHIVEKTVSLEIIITGVLNAILLSLTAIKSYETIVQRAVTKMSRKLGIANKESCINKDEIKAK
jgi:hypothetical protein